jgi:hypothetical protein
MIRVGFEPTIPASERAKTDRSATVTGITPFLEEVYDPSKPHN